MPEPRAKTDSDTSDPDRVRVLLPLPLGGGYDYAVPDGLGLEPGDFVRVPLGPREVIGVVWDRPGEDRGTVAAARLRPVIARLDAPPQTPVLRRFVDWVAAYTLAAPGAVLKMTMSAPGALEPPRRITAYSAGGPLPPRLTGARARVIEVVSQGPPRILRDIAEQAAVSPSVVRGLVKAGTLIAVDMPAQLPPPRPDGHAPGPKLSPDQAEAAAALIARVATETFSVTLLEGVTGAGKTEVYFEAIAAALKRRPGAQVLVLVPEINLTAQWLGRFAARFGAEPLAWHSELTGAQRRRAWRLVADGHARVVVGARSALFLPFADLRLIVVDEEHDPAFKQEDGVIYQARDMAVVRASLGAIAIVLATATPSLETVVNVKRGRYRRVHLGARHGAAALPEIAVIDLRKDTPRRGCWLAPPLIEAMAATFARGEQVLLFLNRRGYAPLTLCRTCGHRLKCPRCAAWLVEHRYTGRLQCHHCDYRIARPAHCPECTAPDSLVACGPGVERMAEEVAATFPDLAMAQMTSDSMTGPRAVAALVRRMEAHELDLVIGTQIVTKGHHFPLLTLVGVIDADLGLSGGDPRAAERTYQQLSQVAGRAGREARAGRVMLQTYLPEHPVIAALASGDQQLFLEREAADREAAGLPPFGRLVALIVSGPELGAVEAAARDLGAAAPDGAGVKVLGPAPAPLFLLRGHYRQRLLLKARRGVNIQRLTRQWLGRAGTRKRVRIRVDIDPYSFL